VYVDGTGDSVSIWALPYSLATLEATGKPFRIAQHGSSPQVSQSGTLVYSDVPSDLRQLAWVDRSGQRISKIGEPHAQVNPTLSPDGRKLAIALREGDIDIWIYDLDRGIKTRLTADAANEGLGAWTPAGDALTYFSNERGNADIFSKSPAGTGAAIALVATPAPEIEPDWSPDGKVLLYTTISRDMKADLWYRERRNDSGLGDPQVFLQTPFAEGQGRFSPDGRFVAYVSDESGRPEIYVRDFPQGSRKWQISAEGGTLPRWSRDGKEIFYVERSKMMAVSVALKPEFTPGRPSMLFEDESLRSPQYDVAPDGKRFVVVERLDNQPPLSIHVAHNWFEDFRGAQGK
jgi:Tol biopolymer transport system component